MINYKIIKNQDLIINSSLNQKTKIPVNLIIESLHHTHDIFDKFIDFGVNVFEILGMRNLSAFIGEVFARSIALKSDGLLISNPHQDGYPDLLLMDDLGLKEYAKLKDRLKYKLPFSPFINGGIEIKATCGSVPTPAICQKKGFEKPEIGDTRIKLLTGYDWKAHHRDTNNLIGLLWDFIDNVPRIVAVFFGDNLSLDDWSPIIQPKEGGGRTTSVSIMTRSGVKKMYDNTVVVIDDIDYLNFLNKYNKSTYLK